MNRRELLSVAGAAILTPAAAIARPVEVRAARGPAPARYLIDQEFDDLRENAGCILACQIGSFFEWRNDDAQIVAPILNIRLTSRRHQVTGDIIPVCGIVADQRFAGDPERGAYALTPTMSYFDALASAGVRFAVAVEYRHIRSDGSLTWRRRLVAKFDGETVRPYGGHRHRHVVP